MGSIFPAEEDQDLSFADLPPFPTDVPTVPLLRISLKNLIAGDAAEEEKLWRACCDLGFFYLDLQDGNGVTGEGKTVVGDELLKAADEMFELAEKVFELDVEEKEKYSMMGQNSYFGYKGYGAFKDRKGIKDRNEFWNVSKDDILGLTNPLPNPEILMQAENRRKFRNYMLGSHAIVRLILFVLNKKLGLPDGLRSLQFLHRYDSFSGDQVRWVRSPPQPPSDRQTALGEHTDYGSVTILFNRLGGLQVLPPDQDTWAYVKPLRGHCVVNLGDAMVKFTAGILRSNIHRVANPPGAQQNEVRYSLVYFNRPQNDSILKALEGSQMIEERKRETGIGEEKEVTAKEWIMDRAFNRTLGTEGERLGKGVGAVAAAS